MNAHSMESVGKTVYVNVIKAGKELTVLKDSVKIIVLATEHARLKEFANALIIGKVLIAQIGIALLVVRRKEFASKVSASAPLDGPGNDAT